MKKSPSNLPTRIRKARAWLWVNSQSYCEEFDKQYLPIKYAASLKAYEELVGQCDVPEQECWKYPEETTAGDMETYEVEFLLARP